MLRFVKIARESIDQAAGTFVVPRDMIFFDLSAALIDPDGRAILVYDADLVTDNGSNAVKLTITDARNGVPYRPPVPVTAAGGYVVRSGSSDTERSAGSPDLASVGGVDKEGRQVLLIFRRGVWDLPKGKLDAGESIEEAALREVREEVGAEDLRIVSPLGVTVHGYPDGKHYAVKTTHWFLMETDDDVFTPQAEEGIEEVRWVAWDSARQMLGYATLREHMASITR